MSKKKKKQPKQHPGMLADARLGEHVVHPGLVEDAQQLGVLKAAG